MLNKSLIHVSLLLIAVLFITSACNSDSPKKSNKPTPTVRRLDPMSAPLYPFPEGSEAPNFKTKLIDGQEVQLSDYKGQVVLINIWATWCAPCREETPELVDLYEEYKDDGFVVLGVSMDKQGLSVVKPFMEKYEVTYPMIIDDGTVTKKYDPSMGIPTTYIINKEGHMVYYAVGAVSKRELEPRIKHLVTADS
jgi:peroxiredoxin